MKNKKAATTLRNLAVKLTEHELIARGKDLVASMQKAARKSENDRRKVAIEAIAKETAQLADAIRSGEEVRAVECDVLMDFSARTVTITRSDTGEVVEERMMTEKERQEPLFSEEEEARAEHQARRQRGPRSGDPLDQMDTGEKRVAKEGDPIGDMEKARDKKVMDADGDPLAGMGTENEVDNEEAAE